MSHSKIEIRGQHSMECSTLWEYSQFIGHSDNPFDILIGLK